MAKRRITVITVLICFCCLWFYPCSVMAASTADAKEPIDVNGKCSLTLFYTCDGTAFEDVSVKLYNVADVSSDLQYKLSSSFEKSALILNGVRTNGEWDVIRSTLEAYIIADNIQADTIAETDSKGQVCFKNLKPGLYLAEVGSITKHDKICNFDSVLVAVPNLDKDGYWLYDVSVAAKPQVVTPDEEITFKATKVWNGDTGRNTRPESIELEIFKDGISYETVVISDSNNWSYSWVAKQDGASWSVVERNIPKEYTMTIEQSDNTFLLTNAFVSKQTFDTPETGDTFNVLFCVSIMMVSGIMFIVTGIIRKRNDNEE